MTVLTIMRVEMMTGSRASLHSWAGPRTGLAGVGVAELEEALRLQGGPLLRRRQVHALQRKLLQQLPSRVPRRVGAWHAQRQRLPGARPVASGRHRRRRRRRCMRQGRVARTQTRQEPTGQQKISATRPPDVGPHASTRACTPAGRPPWWRRR
eukprot:scaffold2207_cov370-Prasinococcus_capsulatus_cf.AAC.12